MSKGIVKSERHEYVTKQGGLSDGVFNTQHLQEYMKGIPFGYIGSSCRTAWADKLVEDALRATGLGNEGIATWLTSNSGRHLADNIQRGHQLDFERAVARDTKNAFLQVTVWSHPDHGGMWSDTMKLEQKIFALKSSKP